MASWLLPRHEKRKPRPGRVVMAGAFDTIFAPASGAGRAAVAVVRISGPATRDAVEALAGAVPPARLATLAALRREGEVLDRALVLWFAGPASFTGEDAAEFQLHGGRAVVAAVLRALATIPGCRPAEAGEFTRRAFLNNKMDLGAVEGLADLIEAETEVQRRQAMRHLEGALGRWVGVLRDDLLSALSMAEGAIDFADEDDLLVAFREEIHANVSRAFAAIAGQLLASGRAEKLRDGVVVTIAGPPNVGKSTLLNLLAGRDVAIVSALAGTTRDTIEVDLDLDGYAMRVIDTAGLRASDDPIEQDGIARARARARSADLVLWLHDGREAAAPDVETRGAVWSVATKADLLGSVERTSDFLVSARTGQGIDGLLSALGRFASEALVGGDHAVVTRLRHRRALEDAQACLARVMSGDSDLELVAEDLRGALRALASLVGEIGVEEVLGTIFARFCIGK